MPFGLIARTAASAGSGAARPCRAAPAARSARGSSPRRAPRADMGERQRLTGGAEPVRLVVDDREPRGRGVPSRITRSMLPGEEPAHAAIGAPGPRAARRTQPSGRRRAGGLAAPPAIASSVSRPVGSSPPGERQLELELVEPVGAARRRADAARRRAARAASRSRPAARPTSPPGSPSSSDRRDWAPATRAAELGVEVRRREIGRLEHRVDERPELDPDRHVAERRLADAAPGRSSDRVGHHHRRRPSRARRSGRAARARSRRRGSCASAVMSL